jgi:hypothetical protein
MVENTYIYLCFPITLVTDTVIFYFPPRSSITALKVGLTFSPFRGQQDTLTCLPVT